MYQQIFLEDTRPAFKVGVGTLRLCSFKCDCKEKMD